MADPAPDLSSPARDAAAAAALERLESGMALGLGSGRALWRLMELIAERWPERPPLCAAVASEVTAERARAIGIDVMPLDEGVRLDLALDGADEVAPDLGLIKGGGAALLREKLVITAAERFVCVAETPKRVERLGQSHALPVEVVRFAWPQTRARVLDLVPAADLRTDAGDEPLVTDEGHYLLDCKVPASGVLAQLAAGLKATVGVVEHGLFLDLADIVLLGRDDGEVEVLERA